MNESTVIYYLCSILSFVPAIVFHEVAHGFAANKLGDPTAKAAGRLSLNPLKHIDPFGTVILPLLLMVLNMPIFGYAKPVPYNPNYFKDKRKGDLITGLAGPCANLVMALIGAGVAWAFWPLVSDGVVRGSFEYYLYVDFLPLFVLINLYLMFFNLLPIPPLDGSSIFAFLLPEKFLPKYYSVQQYAFPVFILVVIFLPQITGIDIFSIYLDATAGNVANLIFPYAIS